MAIIQALLTAIFVIFFAVLATRGRILVETIKQRVSNRKASVGLRIAIALCYSIPFGLAAEQGVQQIFNTSPLGIPNFIDEQAEHIGIIAGAAVAGMIVGLIDSFQK